ncbi:hypothetical protein ACTJI2_00255 [Pseudoxanthomonas sp. 22568]|uniref:hypothetical protein n=1 Tax=Pseudoxanthomonas sp. 22568 TaxID=3453945 RepID=UPI003F860058
MYVATQLDFPTVRSGRVIDRLNRIDKAECLLFTAALESGSLHAMPKLREVHLTLLASDREEVAEAPSERRGSARVTIRFDATSVLEATDADIAWRLYRAGLRGLLAIIDHKIPDHVSRAALGSLHASIPLSRASPFPPATKEQWALFQEYSIHSEGKKSGSLAIELAAPEGSPSDYDFQPVFDHLTATLADRKLGTWVGDSGNDIEFKSKDLSAARILVEDLLATSFAGTFKISLLRD